MWPTFNASSRGDIVIFERISFQFHSIESGDVVVAWSPYDPKMLICKRVRGIEGELVRTKSTKGEPMEVVVPKGHVWLEGDNPSNSRDSRTYGPVPIAIITGRVVFKLWPFSELGRIEHRIVDHTKEV